MSKKFHFSLEKTHRGSRASGALKAMSTGDPAPIGLVLFDDQTGTLTVVGVTAAGNKVDISGVATLEVESDNPAVISNDPPTGMSCKLNAAGPLGTAVITVKVTWNDGSVGPFSGEIDGEVKAGPVKDVVIELSNPVPK